MLNLNLLIANFLYDYYCGKFIFINIQYILDPRAQNRVDLLLCC